MSYYPVSTAALDVAELPVGYAVGGGGLHARVPFSGGAVEHPSATGGLDPMVATQTEHVSARTPAHSAYSDLNSLSLPELLNNINPQLLGDFEMSAPQVLDVLMRQRTGVPPVSAVPHQPQPQTAPTLVPAVGVGVGVSPVLAAPAVSTQFGAPVAPTHAHRARAVDEGYSIISEVVNGAASQIALPPAGSTSIASHLLGAQQPPREGKTSATSASISSKRPRTAMGGVKEELTTVMTTGASAPNGVLSSPDPGMADLPLSSSSREMGGEHGEGRGEVRKALRAERNRQSAAASRERKKHHIKELERRVTILSQENAHFQVEQVKALRDRIEKERELLKENKNLKEKVVFRDMKIHALTKKLEKASISTKNGRCKDAALKRPNTWDAPEWANRNGVPVGLEDMDMDEDEQDAKNDGKTENGKSANNAITPERNASVRVLRKVSTK